MYLNTLLLLLRYACVIWLCLCVAYGIMEKDDMVHYNCDQAQFQSREDQFHGLHIIFYCQISFLFHSVLFFLQNFLI